MTLYNDIAQRDIIKMCEELLRQKILFQRDVDGKLELGEGKPAWDVPWEFTVQAGDLNCQLWSNLMFKQIFNRLPFYYTGGKKFVPSGCMDCFKVVARPKTLKGLFALSRLQKRLDKPAKCGIEHRQYVFGLYGGYWYNRGLDEGLERYKEVRKAINEDPDLGSDTKVILKRACTEMEMEVGPSDKWELTAEQIEMERLIYKHLNCDLIKRRQSEIGVDFVQARWIEFAYGWGDETVFEYLDPDRPIYKPLVTYHHIAEPERDEILFRKF